jgi:hypothetical protein
MCTVVIYTVMLFTWNYVIGREVPRSCDFLTWPILEHQGDLSYDFPRVGVVTDAPD